MRKAAYILGTICVLLSLCGAYLKLSGLPGGAILLILFTTVFSIAAMPLYLYSMYKSETEISMKFALRLGGFSFAVFQVGLLFYVQRWPGEMQMIYTGAAGLIVFLIMFAFNVRKSEVNLKDFSMFGVFAVSILVSLGIGCYDRTKDSEIEQKQYAAYENVRSEYLAVVGRSYELLEDAGHDTLFDDDSANVALLSAGIDLQNYVQRIKEELISNSNYGLYSSGKESDRIIHPLDYDTPTLFMVGVDPANPSGKGLELYDQLLAFKTNNLPAGANFAVPVRDDSEMRVQWVKDSFYHATVLESLTRLTKIQIEICNSVNASVETNISE